MATTSHNKRKTPKVISNWEPHQEKYDDGKPKNWIFVSRAIDTYGLNPTEFRVLAHVARRAGAKGSFASLPTMADECGISERRVSKALKVLCETGILHKTMTGRSNRYDLESDSSKWIHPSELAGIRDGKTAKEKAS
ncbi:MAG: helix-turn-helix domain-containing protein [Phormidesmis sp.]